MFKHHSIRAASAPPALRTGGASSKQRLYDAYVSSGQIQLRDVTLGAEDLFRQRAPYITGLIAKHIPPDRNSRILDLGCGHGDFLYFLKRAGYSNLGGIDVSADQIAMAHRLGISQAEQGYTSDLLRRTENASVDVVLLIDILEHLTRDELIETLDDVGRILRSGGKCIAHVPNAEGLYGMRVRYGDLTHEQAFTPQSAAQVFTTVGFSKVISYEDKPIVHGVTSFARRALWEMGTFPHRLLLKAETASTGFILSQNMLVVASK